MQSLTLRCSPARQARNSKLTITARSFWSLSPKGRPAQQKKPASIDLTDTIGSKRLCTVGAKDYAARSTDTVDFTISDHGGLHVLFEAEGSSNPLDSPSVLFLTDVDSECEVKVDSKPVPKGTKLKLHPGAVVEFGEGVQYIVHRNVVAHA